MKALIFWFALLIFLSLWYTHYREHPCMYADAPSSCPPSPPAQVNPHHNDDGPPSIPPGYGVTWGVP
jgi:hypothetical protein